MKITISASIPSQSASVRIVPRYCSAVAVAIMSTGLSSDASAGRSSRSRARMSRGSSGTSSPAASQASAHMIPGPPALVMIPTLRPRGSGWFASSEATSSSSARLSVRITPACSKRASTVTSEAASIAPGVGAGRPRTGRRAPALHDDDRLPAPDRRATREKRRGSLNDSM